MARYNTFKYGAAKYGTTSPDTLLWGLLIDWDDDGVFTGENEANRMKDMSIIRGRNYFVSPNGDGFEPIQPGQMRIVLNNRDGRYNPYNEASPLYPNVDSGKFIKLIVRFGSTVYNLFSGTIQDIIPNNNRVEILAEDGLRWLQDQLVETQIYQTITADTAIGYVLDAAKWPALWGKSLETGADTLSYWWAYGRNGWEEIRTLADSEFGRAWVDASGAMRFSNRYSTRAAVLSVDQSKLLRSVRIPQPWEVRRNIVQVTSNPITAQATADVWRAAGEYTVDAGATIDISIEFATPATGIIRPVATTDYTAFSLTGGGGVNLTADIVVNVVASSRSATLTITNTGVSLAYLNLLKLRGNPLQQSTVRSKSTGTGATTRPRTLNLNLEWQQNINNHASFSAQTLQFLQKVRELPQVQIEGRPDIQFVPDLFDPVTVGINAMNIGDTFQVGYIQHEWLSENGQAVRTTWKLEPLKEYTGWRFPVIFDSTSILV